MSNIRISFSFDPSLRLKACKILREHTGMTLKDAVKCIDAGEAPCPTENLLPLLAAFNTIGVDVRSCQSPREVAVARLKAAYRMIEDRVVVRVANALASLLEKVG